jgi:hypothetical protein
MDIAYYQCCDLVRGIINCVLKVRALLYITVWWATVDRKGNHTVNYTL